MWYLTLRVHASAATYRDILQHAHDTVLYVYLCTDLRFLACMYTDQRGILQHVYANTLQHAATRTHDTILCVDMYRHVRLFSHESRDKRGILHYVYTCTLQHTATHCSTHTMHYGTYICIESCVSFCMFIQRSTWDPTLCVHIYAATHRQTLQHAHDTILYVNIYRDTRLFLDMYTDKRGILHFVYTYMLQHTATRCNTRNTKYCSYIHIYVVWR